MSPGSTPQPPSRTLGRVLRRLIPLLVVAGLVAALVVGFTLWTGSLEREYAEAEQAHREGHCVTAAEQYRSLVRRASWTGARLIDEARERAVECEAFPRARDDVAGYARYLAEYPEGLAADVAGERMVVGAGDLTAANRSCEVVDALTSFLESQQEPLTPTATQVADSLPRPLLQCGLERYAAGDYARAATVLSDLSTRFPDDPLTAEARPTAIAAQIAAAEATAGELPPPTAVGGTGSDRITVEVVNDSPDGLEILYQGPVVDARTVTACAGCRYYTTASDQVCQGGDEPVVTIELPPGSYSFLVRSTSSDTVTPYAGRWVLEPGTAYSSCFSILRSFG